MKTELSDLSPVKKRLVVEVPASDVAAVYDHLVRKNRQKANIPGFRPGKAPLDLIRARLGEQLHHEAAERIVEEFGREACRRENLRPIRWDVELPEGQEHLSHAHEGEDYKFAMLLEVPPEFEPQDYVGLTIARPAAETAVEDVQKELEALRQSKGKLTDVIDRLSGAGDLVGVEIEGVELGGAAKIAKDLRVIQLGDERNPPEFNRNLSNRRIGEEFTFETAFAADAPDPTLRGKIITLTGVVKSIKKFEAPEWDDDLARSAGEGVKDFADLRERLKELIQTRKEAEADQVARRRLMDKILDANPFEVPESLVEEELHERLQRVGRRLAAQGVDLEKVDIDWRQLAEKERERAAKEVREGLLLDRIAEKEAEHVKVEPQDMDRVIEMMARDMNTTVGKLRQVLSQEGRLASLQREVRRNKCLDWLYSVAHIS